MFPGSVAAATHVTRRDHGVNVVGIVATFLANDRLWTPRIITSGTRPGRSAPWP
jgi:hypothetical protein